MSNPQQDPDFWYINRHALQPGMIFDTANGRVRLVRTVPGDATQWIVDDWYYGCWTCYENTIEPGDLLGQPLQS